MAHHVCPVWIGYLLASPLRRLRQNPQRILGPYVREGMTALDIGCAMGFFSLPLAGLVGPQGRVYCVDVQPGMLRRLEKRVRRAGLLGRLDLISVPDGGTGLETLEGAVDFAMAFYMIHEVPDPDRLFAALFHALRPGGSLLISEPRHHVKLAAFEKTLALAQGKGFGLHERPQIGGSWSALLKKLE